MRKAIIVLLATVIMLILCPGCAHKTTEAYASKKRNEQHLSVLVDSTIFRQLLADIRNTQTKQTDTIVFRDSIFVREYADGSTETYKERNTERVSNYTQVEQLQAMVKELQESKRKDIDTLIIQSSDTTYIYKEKSVSKLQKAINATGIAGLIITVLSIFSLCILRSHR